MDLNFEVSNQKLILLNKDFLCNRTNNYFKCNFDFLTDDWKDKSIFIIFKNYKRIAYKFHYIHEPILLPLCVVEGNRFFVTVYGVSDDEIRITTNQKTIFMKNSGYTDDIENVPEDAPDLIAEVWHELEHKAESVHQHNVSDIVDFPVIPSRTSDLINDSGFLTEHQSLEDYVRNNDSRLSDARVPLEHIHSKNDINDFPVIPSKTSELVNDAGFLTQHQDITMKADKSYVDNLIGNINDYILK